MIHVEHVEASERGSIETADGVALRADYTVTATMVVTNATDMGEAINFVVRRIEGKNHE